MKEALIDYRELIFDWVRLSFLPLCFELTTLAQVHSHREYIFAHLAIIAVGFLLYVASTPTPATASTPRMSVPDAAIKAATTEVAQQPPQLDEPKDDAYTLEELKLYNGTDPNRPIYVAMKGASNLPFFAMQY